MRKMVNGKIIDIDIELFELAGEGLALNKVASSMVFENINIEGDQINKYTEPYKTVYNSMAFPLYAVESKLKYAAIATFIKYASEDCHPMWIEDGEGLFILIDGENMNALKITGSTWGIVRVRKQRDDNTSMQLYKYEPGYAEFSWILNRIRGKATGNFYSEFMPEFVKACNSESMVMKWELTNILNFGSFQNNLNLKENTIINLEEEKELNLDIFSTGVRKTDEMEYVFTATGKEFMRNKAVKVYGYDVYEKDTATGEEGKLQKSKMMGMHNLFLTLSSIKIADERTKMPTFKGILASRDIAYVIEGRLFVCKAYKPSEPQEVAVGVELIGYDRGIIYLLKKSAIGKGVTKESIYSYCLTDGSSRLCKVQFN